MLYTKFLMFVIVISALSACSLYRERNNVAPPDRIVAVSQFSCDCKDSVKTAVQDTFVSTLFNMSNAKAVRGEDGEVVLRGTILTTTGATLDGRSGAEGAYISGMTVQAYKNGELIASYEDGQNLSGGQFYSPIKLASNVAEEIVTMLIRQDYIGRNKNQTKIF